MIESVEVSHGSRRRDNDAFRSRRLTFTDLRRKPARGETHCETWFAHRDANAVLTATKIEPLFT